MSETDPYAAPDVEEANPEAVKANEEAAKNEEATPVVATAPEQAPVEDSVPEGPIHTVLDWVGDDKSRAQAALSAEEAGQKRTTLVAKLNAIID